MPGLRDLDRLSCLGAVQGQYAGDAKGTPGENKPGEGLQ